MNYNTEYDMNKTKWVVWCKCTNCNKETTQIEKTYKQALFDKSLIYKCVYCGTTKINKEIKKLLDYQQVTSK